MTLPLPPLPAVPCEACCNSPARRTVTANVVAVHCEHREAGGIFDGVRWSVYTPVTLAEFGVLVEVADAAVERRLAASRALAN